MKQSLKHSLEHGIPFSDLETNYYKPYVDELIRNAEHYALMAHQTLYDGFAGDDPRVTTVNGTETGEEDQYITFQKDGQPLYKCWDPERRSTDIGIRGVNPNFQHVSNQTTILHADKYFREDFDEEGVPREFSFAIGALGVLHSVILEEIARPFLRRLARTYGVNPDEYVQNFLPFHERPNALTRAVLYHDVSSPIRSMHQPVGSDQQPLLIKEHVDQGSFTFNVYQSSAGLQYKLGEDWVDNEPGVSVFRGTANDMLGQHTPPSIHRVVERHKDNPFRPPEHLRTAGIARLAIVTFIGPVHTAESDLQPVPASLKAGSTM